MLFGPSLSSSINPYLLSDGIPAGKNDVRTSDVLDVGDDGGALFIVTFGAIDALACGRVKLQMSSDNGARDSFADIAGSTEKYWAIHTKHGLLLDVFAPHKRYLRVVVERDIMGCAAIQSIVAFTYHLPSAPEQLGAAFNKMGRLNSPVPVAS
jgi:hypothetical protein